MSQVPVSEIAVVSSSASPASLAQLSIINASPMLPDVLPPDEEDAEDQGPAEKESSDIWVQRSHEEARLSIIGEVPLARDLWMQHADSPRLSRPNSMQTHPPTGTHSILQRPTETEVAPEMLNDVGLPHHERRDSRQPLTHLFSRRKRASSGDVVPYVSSDEGEGHQLTAAGVAGNVDAAHKMQEYRELFHQHGRTSAHHPKSEQDHHHHHHHHHEKDH